ncbi:MAG: haloacid dehalogenase type II [Nitrososphaerota archaeon]|nr:haloacid dehalogenase type II [Nitrososphaerota archaeon]
MKPKYLTFDCYGTLVDWRAGIEAGLRAVLGDVGLGGQDLLQSYVTAERKQESGYKKYRVVLRDTVMSMSAVLGKEVTPPEAEAFASSVPDWPVFPDTVRFLRGAGERGYQRYILSNVDNDLLQETIKRNGLEVDGFVTAEMIGSYKPRPAHWHEFMTRTGAKKEEVLHVAQSTFHDIVPTQGLGIESAWVNRYAERLPRDVFPTVIVDSLASLSRILE